MVRWLSIRQVEALWVRLRAQRISCKRWISNKQELTPKLHFEQCCHSLHTCFGHSLRDCYRIYDLFVKARFNATLPHPIAATVDIAAPPQRTLRNWKTLKTWNWLPEWNLTSTQHRQSTGMEGGKYLNWATCGTWAETHLKTWEKLRQNRKLHRFRRSFWTIPRVKLYTWLVVWERIILPRWSLEYCSPWEGAW